MTKKEIKELAQEVARIIREENAPPEEWLNIDDAALYMRISVRTIYNNINNIPHVKQGKRLMFAKRCLNDYMKTPH